jgi:hypothetical protein
MKDKLKVSLFEEVSKLFSAKSNKIITFIIVIAKEFYFFEY